MRFSDEDFGTLYKLAESLDLSIIEFIELAVVSQLDQPVVIEGEEINEIILADSEISLEGS